MLRTCERSHVRAERPAGNECAGDRHAVPAALPQVALSSEQAAHDSHILGEWFAHIPGRHRPEISVRSDARRLERMAGGIEGIRQQPRVAQWSIDR